MISTYFEQSIASIENQPCLRRPRIQALLTRCIQKPVTLVVVGAGYGKTQAVSGFLQHFEGKVIWQQCTELDNLSTRFWENVVSTLGQQNKALAAQLAVLGFPDTPTDFRRALELCSDAMQSGPKYALVYDDFHLIHDESVQNFIEKLINAHLPNLFILLLSRKEPEIYTLGLISKGLLSHVNESQLRFTQYEMEQYFLMQGLKLSTEWSQGIYAQADGWIFAIHLIALAYKKATLAVDTAVFTMKYNIFKLIENEVFGAVSDALKRFLIKLSLLSHLPLALLRVLSEQEPVMMAELTQITSFVRYDTYLETYSIHHLFLDFLVEKQDRLTHGEKQQVIRKAAEWYAQNGYKIDALNGYEKIGDYRSLILLISLIRLVFSKEECAYFLRILDNAPPNIYLEIPLACIVRARVIFNSGRLEEGIAEIKRVIRSFETMTPSREITWALGESYTSLAMFSRIASVYTGEYDIAAYFEKACTYLPEGSKYAVEPVRTLSIGSHICNVGQPERGAFERFIQAMAEAVPYAVKVLGGWGYGYDDLCWAELAYYRRELKDAERYAYQALFKAMKNPQYHVAYKAIMLLLRNQISSGDYGKIHLLLNKLEDLKDSAAFADNKTLYDICGGWFYATIGQVHKVSIWIRDILVEDRHNLYKIGLESLVRAKSCLAEKKYGDVLALLACQDEHFGLMSYLLGRIEMLVLKAVCLYNEKDKQGAYAALQQAYTLSSPNGFIMPFIEMGNDMCALMKACLKTADCTIPRPWLENILKKASAYAKKLAFVVSQYREYHGLTDNCILTLTRKEQDCLEALCQGLTMAEIAAHWDLSMSAVRNKVESIYNKLGAKNTKDAVRIAISMGLFQDSLSPGKSKATESANF